MKFRELSIDEYKKFIKNYKNSNFFQDNRKNRLVDMKKNTRKVIKLTKGEKMLYTLGVVCFLLTIVIRVFSSASISNLKMDIEKVSYKIENQQKKN